MPPPPLPAPAPPRQRWSSVLLPAGGVLLLAAVSVAAGAIVLPALRGPKADQGGHEEATRDSPPAQLIVIPEGGGSMSADDKDNEPARAAAPKPQGSPFDVPKV